MNKIKSSILHFLSGIEILIRGFSNRRVIGENFNLTFPTSPRVMRTVEPAQRLDFNNWAQHIHSEVVKTKY